jgi:phosphatidylglycerophosphatase A
MMTEADPAAAPLPPPNRRRLAWLIGTFFGVGWLRPGPGTWASACTLGLWWAGARWASPDARWIYTAVASVIITLIGIPASTIVARESGITDPRHAVIDEAAGQLVALIGIPLRWQYVLASFILFRGFDILKPPPLRRLEKIPRGWGIMLDDVGAGIYAGIVTHLLLRFRVLG